MLYRHPSVQAVGVIGLPDGQDGGLVQAHVVLRDGSPPLTPAQMIDFARTRLAGHKVPVRVILTARLPLGLTGKVDRLALRRDACP